MIRSGAVSLERVMGNTNSCVGHLRDVVLVWICGSGEGEDAGAGSRAREDAPCLLSPDLQLRAPQKSDVVATAASSGSDVVSVEQQIEKSKTHWSELTEFDSGSSDIEDVEAENWEVWKDLYSNETWVGAFFRNFGYEFEGYASDGSLEIGEKFAEGGQAELFHAKVDWSVLKYNELDLENRVEWVVKVFKKGTPLKHLQSQWPHGMLQFRVEERENRKSRTWKDHRRNYCEVSCGTLLEDGRFAFLMEKEHLDLRTFIDHKMMVPLSERCGPFSKEVCEELMFDVALGMSWLHSRDIVHRDLKASNVLINFWEDGSITQCFVADYECSIGVVGTGFFRAPEILQACKDRNVTKRPELFTKSSDVYSYGMTCYEILTGRLPFDGHRVNDYDYVINGNRPEVSKYIVAWVDSLLRECWQPNPPSRPSFEDIVNIIYDNSTEIRRLVEGGKYTQDDDMNMVDEIDWISWRTLALGT